jgi:hypothetical protein
VSRPRATGRGPRRPFHRGLRVYWPRLLLEPDRLLSEEEPTWFLQRTLIALGICERCGCWAPVLFLGRSEFDCDSHYFPFLDPGRSRRR